MRKISGSILVFIGVLALVFAATATFWTSDQVKRTPLDTDSTTHLAGTASLSGAAPVPVKALSLTRTDSVRSTKNVVVFNSSSCLVIIKGDTPDCVEATDPEGRLLAAGSEIFGADRTTGEAVNDPKILPADAVEKQGLVNKWPFDAKKKTYQYWDSLVGEAVPATYVGEEKIEGLNTYEYNVDIVDAPIQIADGVPGMYSTSKKLWVEPRTGSIVKQAEQQERVTTDGSPVLAIDLAFTDAQVKTSVADTEKSVKKLVLISKMVPIGGLIVGVLALAGGIFLMRPRRHPTHS